MHLFFFPSPSLPRVPFMLQQLYLIKEKIAYVLIAKTLLNLAVISRL